MALTASMAMAVVPSSFAVGNNTWSSFGGTNTFENIETQEYVEPDFVVGYSGEPEVFTLDSAVEADGTLTLTEGTDYDVTYTDINNGTDLTNVGKQH